MTENTKFKISYISIPVLGIIFTVFSFLFSYLKEFKTNFMLLNDFDFTGMTSIYLYAITIINLIILSYVSYLTINIKNNSFPYNLNKIFTILFLFLSFVSLLSFIIIRNREEIISKEFEAEVSNITNNVIYMDSFGTKLNQMKDFASDKFSSVKINIANEIKYMPTFERYIYLFTYKPSNNSYNIPEDEDSYYSLFSRFALIDLFLGISFALHIKDKKISERTNIDLNYFK